MPKRPNLATTTDAAAIADAAGSTRRRPEEKLKTVPRPDEQEGYKQPSRVDTVPVGGHFPETVRDQLKLLAIERRTTSQDLLAEALNDLFAKYGKPEIAPRRSE